MLIEIEATKMTLTGRQIVCLFVLMWMKLVEEYRAIFGPGEI